MFTFLWLLPQTQVYFIGFHVNHQHELEQNCEEEEKEYVEFNSVMYSHIP